MKNLFSLLVCAALLSGCTNPVKNELVTVRIHGKFIQWIGFPEPATIVVTVDGDTVFCCDDNAKRLEGVSSQWEMYYFDIQVEKYSTVIAKSWFVDSDTLSSIANATDGLIMEVK